VAFLIQQQKLKRHIFSGIKYSSKHSKKFVEVIKYKIKPVL